MALDATIKCKACVFRYMSNRDTLIVMLKENVKDDLGVIRSARWTIAVLSLSALLASIGTSIANVALPSVGVAFDVAFSDVQWIVLAYLLAVTASTVGAGRLGDAKGRRRTFVSGVILFSIASAVCSFAPTLWVLIAARVAQGLGAAAMMALSMALVSEIVPKERVGRALGTMGSMSAVGTALGPMLGGFLIAEFGWRAIFLINVPLGLIAAALAIKHLPSDRPEPKNAPIRMDLPGTVLLASALGAFSLSMTSGGGSFGWINTILLVSSAVCLGFFAFVQTRSASPLIKVEILRDQQLISGLMMSVLVTAVVMASLVVGPFYLSGGLGLGTFELGLVMSCGPLVAALVGAPAGRAVDHFGTYRMTLAGLAAMTIGAVSLASLPLSVGVIGYVAPLVVLVAGYAVFQAANNTAVMARSRSEDRGMISGLVSLSRNFGLIIGASAMGAIFAAFSGGGDPKSVAKGMNVTFAAAGVLVVLAITIAFAGRAICRRAGSAACGDRLPAVV